MAQKKVTIVGSGNWGSAISRNIGFNTKVHAAEFECVVQMWVYEELIDGKKLSEIINTQHENVKYLPGKKLPENVFAETDLVKACTDADVLVFVVPHQHVPRICSQIQGKIKPSAVAISLIKGVGAPTDKGISLISEEIGHALGGIEVAVLMGANLAPEVAEEQFCEATIGSKNAATGQMLKKLFHTDNFRITVVRDVHTVELCGALKNVVACAAGFSDGLGYGDNTKAALIRLGLMEMVRYVEHYYPGANDQRVFFESCGVADLVTTCYGGRNRRVCEAFVKQGRPLADVERDLLNGQSAQGPLTAADLFVTLGKQGIQDRFPLFTTVHRICTGELPPSAIIENVRNHPVYGQDGGK